MRDEASASRIAGLSDLIAETKRRGIAPVESWDPPHCGDIGLAILDDATWTYLGSPITRLGFVKLFASVLRRDEDGKFYLVTPVEKVDVSVADAPFLAVEMDRTGQGNEQRLTFRTNVDDMVECGPDHPLQFATGADGGARAYIRVRGQLDARLSRALTFDVMEHALADAQNTGLWSGGVWFPLGAASAG